MRYLRFGRHGLQENPVGQIVRWGFSGHERVAKVTGVFNKNRGAGMGELLCLSTKLLNGDPGPDVSAYIVKVLEPNAEWFESPDPD